MSAVVIDLSQAEDHRDVVHRAVEAISAGKLVALPTETVYGLFASALHPEAVKKLYEIKGGDPQRPLALATKSFEDALDYCPDMSPLARRIARRSWPGPLTLVHSAKHCDSVVHRLSDPVRQAIIPLGKIGLRVPAHELTLQVMRLCAGPIAMTIASRGEKTDAQTAEAVEQSVGDEIDLILDDGPCQLGVPSSVVEIDNREVRILREGGIDQATLKKLGNFVALIVCTGNTCRSPMGEALFKQLVAEKLNCSTDQLIEKGIQVASAGIAAMPGSPASQQSVEVMTRLGIDIGDHASQPITGRMAQFADLILTMTRSHRHALISQWPLVEPRIKTLRRDGGDVTDPIGSPVEIYDACAQQISENLKAWIDEIDWSIVGQSTVPDP